MMRQAQSTVSDFSDVKNIGLLSARTDVRYRPSLVQFDREDDQQLGAEVARWETDGGSVGSE